jgi:hypothetical protein
MTKRRRPSAASKTEAAARARQLATARRRAIAAKATFTAVAAVVFGAGLVVTKHTFAGHAKEPTEALATPPRYVHIVKKNLLEAGVVAPAEAPPGAASAAS